MPQSETAHARLIAQLDAYARAQTEGFTGRSWCFQALAEWARDSRGPRTFAWTGEPGSGKTALAARLWQFTRGHVPPPATCSELGAGFLAAAHFCSARDAHLIDPRAFARNLALQLAFRFESFARALVEQSGLRPVHIEVDQEVGSVSGNAHIAGVVIGQLNVHPMSPADAFEQVVRAPLEALYASGFDRPLFILVDGLDEALHYGGETTIVDLLAQTAFLPSAVRFIVTSAPATEVTPLLAEAAVLDLTGEEGQARSCEDIGAFLRRALTTTHSDLAARLAPPLSADRLVEALVAQSEGNFLYARQMLEALAGTEGAVSADHLSSLPAGLDAVFQQLLARLVRRDWTTWEERYMPLLGTLAVARAPLDESHLARFTALAHSAVRSAVRQTRPLLDEHSQPPKRYTLFHRALADFLLDENRADAFWCPTEEQHARIADAAGRLFPDLAAVDDEYLLEHLAYHLRRAGPAYTPTLHALISPHVRQAKRRHFGSDAVFLNDIAEALAALQEQPWSQRLPHVVRLGFIEATLRAATADIDPNQVRDLARAGRWERAFHLARTGTAGRDARLLALVKGMLAAGEPAEQAYWVAAQAEGASRAQALALVAGRLAAEAPNRALIVFEEAVTSAREVRDADTRARTLAAVARRLKVLDAEQAHRLFEEAEQTVRAMPEADLPTELAEDLSLSTAISQTASEMAHTLDTTPFDTLGAKARALADVAAELAKAGEGAWAERLFAQAEALLTRLEGGEPSPSDGLPLSLDSRSGFRRTFAEHTRHYIEARRHAGETPLAPPDIEKIEATLVAAERPPKDVQGHLARALLALAAACAPEAPDTAAQILGHAVQASREAEGQYRANLLVEAATLWHSLGREAEAAELLAEAEALAGTAFDPAAAYREWLAARGRDLAVEFREVAAARVGFVKQRAYGDRALAHMVQALAPDDLTAAITLAERVRDPWHRARAWAAVAASAFVSEDNRLLEAAQKHVIEAAQDVTDRDGTLIEAVQIMAAVAPAAASRFAEHVTHPANRAAALALIAHASSAEEAAPLWGQVWHTLQTAEGAHAGLAAAATALAVHFAATDHPQAPEAFAIARQQIQSVPSAAKRLEMWVDLVHRLHPHRPAWTREILGDLRTETERIAGSDTRARALARTLGVHALIAPEEAVDLLAGLRAAGPEAFLTGVATLGPEACRQGGAPVALRVAEALMEGRRFWPSGA